MEELDKKSVIDRYSKRYHEYGYSPKTLGWFKGKQEIRYKELLNPFELEGKRILDIGCGFGDGVYFIKERTKAFEYVGIDIVPVLIDEGKQRFKGEENITFICDEFLAYDFKDKFDVVIASGIFNFKMINTNSNFDFIEKVVNKAFGLAKEGVSMDFLSTEVDFKHEHTFHSKPGDILDVFYKHTRNLILRNDVMPFEFIVTGYLDDAFDVADTLFERYKNAR